MRESEEPALEAFIDDLYRGSLDTFVSRRDALAKQRRTSGDRLAASMVKALKKPSRAAWALNFVVLDKPDAMAKLDAAISGAVAPMPSGEEGRAAIARLRAVVRQLAIESAQLASEAGTEVEVDVLVGALSAVLGHAESFEELRHARLTDVPEAGGLDLLALLPILKREKPAAIPLVRTAPAKQPDESKARMARAEDERQAVARAAAREEDERQALARAAAKEAASRLESARRRAEEARKALDKAEDNVKEADARVRQAEEDSLQAIALRDAAREQSAIAQSAVGSAEKELLRLKTQGT
ncbi:hypothetical protein AYO38_09210 [bacterium SCGC AG-212-C10]|nr:hypothetical protein AYO38_09210 [bacterium SCGC AG-212-C10]